jgi:hypothetical protein
MTTNQILENTRLNKSQKIRLLLAADVSHEEIAARLGVNCGFIRNVQARVYGVARQRVARQGVYTFTRSFGIEIEACGIAPQTLANELRAVGIECQAEGYNHTRRDHWKVVSDGSVRGDSPFELVSPVLNGQEGLETVRAVCGVLNRLGAKINKTCGLHVHFGVGELEHEARFWRNLINNYADLEPSIDAVMPPSRRGRNNVFCKPVAQPGLRERLARCRDLRAIERATTNGNRYHKVNLSSFWRHKTVEFRHHSGTTDFEKISNWVRLLSRLVEFSRHSEVVEHAFEGLREFATADIHTFYNERRLRLAA